MKSTSINKKKVIVIIAIALVAAVGVSLLAVSCTADTGNGTASTNVAIHPEELEEPLDDPEQTDVVEEAQPDNSTVADSVSDGNETENSASSETQPSAASQNVTRSSVESEKPSTSTSSSGSSVSKPSKHWVEDTQQVWVEDRAAWTEQVPVYSSKEVSICNICGQDITGNTSAHAKAHMMAGEGSGHHSEVRKTVSGYNIVNHPAEGHYETKVVGGHWE